jgi:hypothetical protein
VTRPTRTSTTRTRIPVDTTSDHRCSATPTVGVRVSMVDPGPVHF